MPEGAYAPAIIVLLTDGASNAGPGAGRGRAAGGRLAGIRVYTIGFGTEDPGGRPPRCGAQYIGSEPGDSGGKGSTPGSAVAASAVAGGGLRRAIDEETLMAVAEATGGEYYLGRERRAAQRGLRRSSRPT